MGLLKSVLLILSSLGIMVMQTGKEIVHTGPELGLPFSPAVKAGGFIYLSGALATDEKGLILSGDIRAQTRQVIENLARVLEAAGSDLAHAASVSVYLKRAGDFPAMNEIYRGYWPKDPPVRTTVVSNLVLPEALVEMSMVAIPRGGPRQAVHPPDWVPSTNPYSYGIRSGDTLFMSGLVSRSGKDNRTVAGDTRAQTRTVLENGAAILQAAGMSFGDVVSARVFITDQAAFQGMNEVYRTFFPKDPPARATVRTGLMNPDFLVEITLVAVAGGPREVITAPEADGSAGRVNPNLSSAIRAGNRLFLSGMLGQDESNRGDAGAQTRQTLERLGRTLKAAGFDWSHVVDGVVYLTDVQNYPAMNDACRQVFSSEFPARATVETGLVAPDALVEIMVTAVK